MYKTINKYLLILVFAVTTLNSQAQTAISATGVAPDASAMFDVTATNKGMLIPRVALTGTTDAATITTPAVSLLVYNTATAGGVTPGYYFNNGTTGSPVWSRLINGNGTFPTGSGTLNYHAKWTPDGVTLGNSIVYDNGTNVGISSATPGGKLDVYGGPVTLSAGYLDINRDAYTQNGISWYAQSYPSWSTYMSPAAQTATGPHADLTAPSGAYVTSWALRNYIENAAGYGWTFESAANTTTPAVKFEIRASDGLFHSYGDGYVDGVVYAGASARMGTNIAAGYYQDATNGAYRAIVGSGTTNGYYFQTNGGAATTMYVGLGGTYNGNVGIGTTTPTYKLHVPSGYIGTDYINTTDNSVASGVTGVMIKAGDNFLRTGTAAAVASFLGTSLAGNYVQNQNGSAQVANYWINGTANSQAGYISTSNPWGTSNSAYFPNGITTAAATNWIYGSTNYIGNAPSNGYGHQFNAASGNSSAWLAIGGGNVGIGTTTPGWKLDVAGNARVGDNTGQNTLGALAVSAGQGSATTYRDIDLHGSWAANEGHAITASHATGASNIVGQIVFEHNSPGSRIKFGRLYHSGDQSTYPMELVSNGANAILRMNNDAYDYFGPNSTWGAYLQVGGNGRVTTGASVAATNGNLHLDAANGGFATYINYYSANPTFINANAGNVGIGTTNPTFKLHVPSGYIGADYINTTDNSVGSGVTGVMIKAGDNYLRTGTANAVATFLNGTTTGPWIPNNGSGDWQIASSSTSTSYSVGSLELRESNFSGAGGTPPHLGLHWGGVVASNITIESSGTVAIRDNPGTGYENFKARNITGNIFYDSDNTGYYWDGNNETRMYRSEAQYGWGTWVQYDANDGNYYVDPNGTSRYNYLGRNYGWNWTEYDWNDAQYYEDLNNISIMNQLRVRFIYDYDNTGYYLDPNGTTYVNSLMFNYVPMINGYYPPNNAIRMTPNFHLNNPSGYAVIVNWDNGGYQGGSQVFRVGRGDGNDNFYVCGDGTTHMSLYGGGHVYVGWNWPYNYYCGSYSCGWWNNSSCASYCNNEKFHVNGNATSYGWVTWSDGRYKKNVGTVGNALAMVKKMRGVTYDWKTNGVSAEEVIKNADPVYIPLEDVQAPNLRSNTGFIAQELQEILPSAVTESQDLDTSGNVIGTHLNVNYDAVVPVLVEAIKEQQKQIDELKALLGVATNQTQLNITPPSGASAMNTGKSNSDNLSVKEAIKLLEDNLKFMTKEHQEQMKDFINEIKAQDKLTADQLHKVLEFRNNVKEFQKNSEK